MSWKWVCRLVAAVFPWTPRAERKAQVAAARRRAEVAQRKTVEARSLNEELHQLRRKNHVSEALDLWVSRRAREQ